MLGDPLRLEGAVVNVVGNAVKYTPRGGSVTVRTFEDAGHVVVEVADTGIGVPFDELAHLTEPWFRARNATASGIGGDGLGLALVRDVVEAHGGEVSLTSVDGAGTTVRLLLPAAGARCLRWGMPTRLLPFRSPCARSGTLDRWTGSRH